MLVEWNPDLSEVVAIMPETEANTGTLECLRLSACQCVLFVSPIFSVVGVGP